MLRSRFARIAVARPAVAVAAVVAMLALAAPAGADPTINEPACGAGGVGNAAQLRTDVDSVAGSGGTVNLAADCTYTFTDADPGSYASGPATAFAVLSAEDQVTINGNGSTIAREAGSPEFSFFYVGGSGGYSLALNDVTLKGGADAGGFAGAVMVQPNLTGAAPSLVVNDSTFIDNTELGGGASAIYANGQAAITVSDSTFSGNVGSNTNGAILALENLSTITNSTFVDNQSKYDTVVGGAFTTIQGSTFEGNVVSNTGYPVVMAGNGTISGSIFADGPDALECQRYETGTTLSYDVFESSSTIASSNVDGGHACGYGSGSTDEFSVSTSALALGPLQDNGATVQTVGIGPGSAAYHFVPMSSGFCQATDERGVSRPQPPVSVQGSSAFCDAGAFEYLPATITWAAPAPIQYGAPLSAAQLDASAADMNGGALPGTFSYSPAVGTVLGNPGVYQLSLTFTPTGDTLYGVTTASVPLTVEKASEPGLSPSNAFSLVSKKVTKTGAIKLGVRTDAPGSLSATAAFTEKIAHATGNRKHHKTATYGTATAISDGQAIAELTITPTKRIIKLLKQHKILRLKLTLHFTPTGGQANELLVFFTVKAPHAKR